MLSLPVMVPTFIVLILVRLSSSSRSSRQRIKLLEGDSSLRENALVHAFARFESEMERAVIDAIEDNQGGHPDRDDSQAQQTNGLSTSAKQNGHDDGISSEPPTSKIEAEPKSNSKKERKPKQPIGQPVLSAAQLAMVDHLNTIPQLTKHMVYIDNIRNSHATIVARDVKNYEFHKRGWAVLRHLADGFVL